MKKFIFIVSMVVLGAAAMVAVAVVLKLNFSDAGIVLPEAKKPVENTTTPAEDTTTPPLAKMTLEMKKWTWVKAELGDETVVTAKSDVFTLSFTEGGKVGIGTDCNGMGAKYEADDGALTFTQMISTLMFCEGSQESQFSQLLQDVDGYSFNDKNELVLTIKDDGGTMLFR